MISSMLVSVVTGMQFTSGLIVSMTSSRNMVRVTLVMGECVLVWIPAVAWVSVLAVGRFLM